MLRLYRVPGEEAHRERPQKKAHEKKEKNPAGGSATVNFKPPLEGLSRSAPCYFLHTR